LRKLKLATVITSMCLSTALVVSMAGSTFGYSGNGTAQPLLKMTVKSSDSSGQSPSGYSPAQIKKAYGIDRISGTGKGQTIALIVAYNDPNITSDVATFSNKFSLPQANITIKDLGDGSTDSGWALETSLDVEWAHAIAPDANLLVVEAASESIDDLMSAVDTAVSSGAQVVSMSWGGSEDRMQTYYDSHFNSSSTVFVAAAGDDAAGAEWPASSPNVIAVGGTTLNLDSSGNRISESAWQDGGGGVSLVEPEPQWQTAMGIITQSRSRGMRRFNMRFTSGTRVLPDVSFDADPTTGVSVYCSVPQSGTSGWFTLGGTSLSAPSWAGLISDINQNGVVIKNAGSLYTLAGGTSYTNTLQAFNDITTGSNGYQAVTGYDAASGLGTPEADKLAPTSQNLSLQALTKRAKTMQTKLPKMK
jgi:subtilase family serine protease